MRYETVVATLVGVLALCVSAYTAYVQRQQVRAQVWPILEYSTSNQPGLRLSIANKGVGPALIKHVIVSVDGAPIRNWIEALEKVLGPGKRNYSESDIGHAILSAGENIDIFTPADDAGAPLTPGGGPGSDGARFNQARTRFGVEVLLLLDAGGLLDAAGCAGEDDGDERDGAVSGGVGEHVSAVVIVLIGSFSRNETSRKVEHCSSVNALAFGFVAGGTASPLREAARVVHRPASAADDNQRRRASRHRNPPRHSAAHSLTRPALRVRAP